MSYDYSNTPQADFILKCNDGELKFTKYILYSIEHFKTLFDFNGIETKENCVTLKYSVETINCILNYIDKYNGRPILPDDVGNIFEAAHYFIIPDLLLACENIMIQNPKNSYIAIMDKYECKSRIKFLKSLVDQEKLEQGSIDLYRELFLIPEIDKIKLLESFARTKHEFDDSFRDILQTILKNSYDYYNAFMACRENGNEDHANYIARLSLAKWYKENTIPIFFGYNQMDPSDAKLKADIERRKKRKRV